MPNTQRSPLKQQQGHRDVAAVPAAAQGQDVQDIDFHGDVVVVVNANNQPSQQFESTFKQKNAQVKRTITRTSNLLVPLESGSLSHLHNDNITRLRTHLGRINTAIDALNDFIDTRGEALPDETLQAYVKESDAHTPAILDLCSRINQLEHDFKQSLLPPPPTPPPTAVEPKRTISKIDNTFKPRLLDDNATHVAFNKWRKDFMVYMSRNGFEDAPVNEIRVLVNNCLTPQMENTLSTVCELEDDASLAKIMQTLHKYFLDSNNITTQRFAFFNCVQEEGESIRQYMTRFRNIGDFADFDNFSYRDNMACRLLTGVRDEDLRKQLMRLPTIDFSTVSKFALAWESGNINADRVATTPRSTTSTSSSQVDKISAYKANRRSDFRSVSRTSTSADQDRRDTKQSGGGQVCFNCGYARHPLSSCPARNQSCSYCKKQGHFAKVCRSAKSKRSTGQDNQKVRQIQGQNEAESGSGPGGSDRGDSEIGVEVDVGNLDFAVFLLDSRIQAPTPKVKVLILSSHIPLGEYLVVPDTGAAVSVLPSALAHSWGMMPRPLQRKHALTSAGGDSINCLGTLTLNIRHNEVESEVVFFVCEGVRSILLSWLALKNLWIVSPKFPKQLKPDRVLQVDTEVINDHINNIKNEYLSRFPSVFNNNNSLTEMRGPPMVIHLRDDFQPQHVKQTIRPPRPVPVPLHEAVHRELMSMVKSGIIRPIHEPTDFVSPLVVVPKKSNKVRLVVDYNQLNKFVRHPNHPFPSVSEVRALLPPTAKFFATLDAVQGYLQVPLHPSSQPLTTFITPWGRFCFRRAPMGLSCSGDVFCARGDQAFQAIPNIIKVVDDILVFADDLPSLQRNITAVLEAAKHHGITLSSEKFNIGTTVDFVGFSISHNSISLDAKHFKAIAEFPTPRNKTDLRSLLGLANQFSAFSSKLSSVAKPLRPLLSKAMEWKWEEAHQVAFDNLRHELVNSSTLHCFHPGRKTKLLTDASRLNGLGYALMQYLEQESQWTLIACGSRFINDTEANYAVFELEALAIVWAIQKCCVFLLGLQSFDVVTDHRPLVSIFNSTRLSTSDNPRILRLLQKVSMYSFQVIWTPGRSHLIPDALSRAPLPHPEPARVAEVSDDVEIHAPKDSAIDSMSVAATEDASYQDIVQAIRTMRLHEVQKLPISTHSHVRILSSLWNRMSVDPRTSLVLLDTSRILVPMSHRQLVIGQVHKAHQGITRTKARMQALYFWPGMSNEIVQAVQSCALCQKYRDEQPAQPITPHPRPDRPFQAISVDVFEYRKAFFMTYVDRFSGWPSVAHFHKSPSSGQIMAALTSIFKDFGVPNTIRHDGATPFVSDQFKTFLNRHRITDELTSAYNPASNGHAEASVKAMKLLVKKCWIKNALDAEKFAFSLLEWRNTPKYPGNLSPAEMVFARKLRSGAPAISYDMLPNHIIQSAVRANYSHLQKAYQSINDSRKRQLPPLAPGDNVRIRNPQTRTWDKCGVVVTPRNQGQSYILDTQGKRILRNRRLLTRSKD